MPPNQKTVKKEFMNNAEIHRLSIVVPLYNEAENVRPLFEKIQAVCDELDFAYELLFVDDGSRDDTFAELTEIHKIASGTVKVIRFGKNAGQTAAMAAGFEFAQGQRIISMDGDLQNDPADIPKLLQKLDEGYTLVCGWRKARQDKFWTRRVPSVAANWIIAKVTGVPIHDNGCSLKAYRAETIKRIPLYGEMHRFIPAMATLVGARISEIVVTHHPRQFGTSKYGLARIWRVIIDIFAFKAIITVFAHKPEKDKQHAHFSRDTSIKRRVWLFSLIASLLPFLSGLGILLANRGLMPAGIGCCGLGACRLALGWITAREIQHARSDTTEPGRLARFFLGLSDRRPLRVFGPLGAIGVLASIFIGASLIPMINVDALLWIVNLIIFFIPGSFLVFEIGLLGELVAFANAHRVKDYTVVTFLR